MSVYVLQIAPRAPSGVASELLLCGAPEPGEGEKEATLGESPIKQSSSTNTTVQGMEQAPAQLPLSLELFLFSWEPTISGCRGQ